MRKDRTSSDTPVVLECPYKDCISADECIIVDIMKRIPPKKESCSYFKSVDKIKKK